MSRISLSGVATRIVATLCLTLALSAGSLEAQRRGGTSEGRLLREAAARESRGDLEGAEVVLRQLLETDPRSSGGLFALERVLRAQGQTGDILPTVDAFLIQDPTSSGVRYLKLRVLAELDSLGALEAESEAWFQRETGSEVPYREVARVYERTFGAERALAVLRQGRDAVGRDDALALEIGDLLAAMDDQDGAVDEWAVAVGDDGGQAAAIARRVQGLVRGSEAAGRRLVERLGESEELPRRRAGARIALDLGLDQESLALVQDVADELDGRARESFLADAARRARDAELVEVASWAYDALGAEASSPSERRQFDQRIVDVSLSAGDTVTALDAQRRVAESYSPGSVDRRRATAEAIRLEAPGAEPERLSELLSDFRAEFPDAPELDLLASTVSAGLLARDDPAAAAAVLEGIEGPRSGIERAYLLFAEGEVDLGRQALLLAITGLEPEAAIEVIQLAGLFGRLSPDGGAALAEAGVLAHRGQVEAGARLLAAAVAALPLEEHPPVLAEAARMAERGGHRAYAAEVREVLVAGYADAPEASEAALYLARYVARTPAGLDRAIRMLEDLIANRPNAAVVPDARLELERLKERGR